MKIIRIAILSSALSFLTLPAEAAVIDQVKSKVEAIKNETSIIKNKVNDIVRELEPLMQLKQEFRNYGFDPSTIMDAVDMEQITAKFDEMRQKREEIQDAMNSLDIEAFRYDLVSVLSDINILTAVGDVVEVSPLQRLVEVAPAPVITAMWMAVGDKIPALQESVIDQFADLAVLDALGVSTRGDSGSNAPASGGLLPGFVKLSGSALLDMTADQRQVLFCGAWSSMPSVPIALLNMAQWRNTKTIRVLNDFDQAFETMSQDQLLQIHGYVGITLKPGDTGAASAKRIISLIAHQNAEYGYMKEWITFLALSSHCESVVTIDD